MFSCWFILVLFLRFIYRYHSHLSFVCFYAWLKMLNMETAKNTSREVHERPISYWTGLRNLPITWKLQTAVVIDNPSRVTMGQTLMPDEISRASGCPCPPSPAPPPLSCDSPERPPEHLSRPNRIARSCFRCWSPYARPDSSRMISLSPDPTSRGSHRATWASASSRGKRAVTAALISSSIPRETRLLSPGKPRGGVPAENHRNLPRMG